MVIAEYLDETRGVLKRDKRLFAEDPMERAEIRRLTDWYLNKTESEVTRHLVRERVLKPLMPETAGGGSPDSAAIRAARANIRQHMKYTNWLAGTRHWLAGTEDHLCRSRGRGDAVGARLSRRGRLARARRGARMVHAGEVAALLPAAACPTGCAACRRCRIMRTSISDRQPKPLRALIDREARLRRLRRGRGHLARRHPAGRRTRLAEFVADGFHGSMDWIAETLERRGDPRRCGREVRSIIVLAMNYGPDRDPRGDAGQARPRRDLGLCAEPRLSRGDEGPAEGDRRHASWRAPAAT